jgi:hypothetical protein
MVRLTLVLSQELIAKLERYAERSGQSIPSFIREELKLRYLHQLPEPKRRGIYGRLEIRQAIQLKMT